MSQCEQSPSRPFTYMPTHLWVVAVAGAPTAVRPTRGRLTPRRGNSQRGKVPVEFYNSQHCNAANVYHANGLLDWGSRKKGSADITTTTPEQQRTKLENDLRALVSYYATKYNLAMVTAKKPFTGEYQVPEDARAQYIQSLQPIKKEWETNKNALRDTFISAYGNHMIETANITIDGEQDNLFDFYIKSIDNLYNTYSKTDLSGKGYLMKPWNAM